MVLFHVAYGLPFAIFLLRNYFAEIPREMLEAARMDGGSEWRIFSRLVLPLGRPAIASLAIFQFLWVWNDMLVALLFADSTSQPLTVALQSQMRQFGSNIDVLAPGAFLSLIVPVVVFFAFQRHFVAGGDGGLGEMSPGSRPRVGAWRSAYGIPCEDRPRPQRSRAVPRARNGAGQFPGSGGA